MRVSEDKPSPTVDMRHHRPVGDEIDWGSGDGDETVSVRQPRPNRSLRDAFVSMQESSSGPTVGEVMREMADRHGGSADDHVDWRDNVGRVEMSGVDPNAEVVNAGDASPDMIGGGTCRAEVGSNGIVEELPPGAYSAYARELEEGLRNNAVMNQFQQELGESTVTPILRRMFAPGEEGERPGGEEEGDSQNGVCELPGAGNLEEDIAAMERDAVSHATPLPDWGDTSTECDSSEDAPNNLFYRYMSGGVPRDAVGVQPLCESSNLTGTVLTPPDSTSTECSSIGEFHGSAVTCNVCGAERCEHLGNVPTECDDNIDSQTDVHSISCLRCGKVGHVAITYAKSQGFTVSSSNNQFACECGCTHVYVSVARDMH